MAACPSVPIPYVIAPSGRPSKMLWKSSRLDALTSFTTNPGAPTAHRPCPNRRIRQRSPYPRYWLRKANDTGSPAAARYSPAAVGCSRLLGFVATHTDRSVHRAGARAACVRAGDPPGTATATGTSHGPRAHANRFEPPR